jgi:TonB-linked SusC/RagA family outer membrane protein
MPKDAGNLIYNQTIVFMKKIVFSSATAMTKLTAITALLLLGFFTAAAHNKNQDILSRLVTLSVSDKELKAVLKDVSRMTGARFLYSREIIQSDRRITVSVRDKPLSSFLAQVLTPLGIGYETDKNGYIFLNVIPAAETKNTKALHEEGRQAFPPKKITGKVVSTDGTPVDGASVEIKETNNGTATNRQGLFTLVIAETEKTLVVTATGFERKEIPIGHDSSFLISLKQVAVNLDEVVVIGYGEQKRKDVTGAIASIKADDIKNLQQSGIDQMLQGKVPGVSVAQNSGAPGGGVSVRVRGVTTLQSKNEPLYVIDGVPVDANENNDLLSLAGDGETRMSALNGLNPGDILSIDVLKDASAAAIYGNRAANGVILITTKKGRTGEGKIAFSMYGGVQKAAKYLNLLNLPDYATYKNSIADFLGNNRQPEFNDLSVLGKGTDWQREIFTPAVQQNYDLSLSGGRSGTTYYISGNYYKQEGTIIGSGFNRKSVRLNMDNQLKNWLKIGVNATFSNTDQDITLANTGTGVISMAIRQSPDVPVWLADGTFGGPNDQTGFGNVGVGNPVAQAVSWKTEFIKNKLMGNVYAQISFLKDFSFRTDFGTDFNWNKSSTFLPTYEWGTVKNELNKYTVQNSQTTFWNMRNVLTWHKAIGRHDVTVMGGQEALKSTWNTVTSSRSNFPANDISSINLGDQLTASATENKGKATQESYFARAIYSYDSRYALTATLRRDRTSKFAPGHQVGYFPAASIAWTVSNEEFMKYLSNTISHVKLRFGYGEVGNQNIPNYSWGSALSPTFSNSAVGSGTVFMLSNIANPNVTWEHATQSNLGVEVEVMNRLSLVVDLYNKISKKFLFSAPWGYYTGGAPVQGVGISAPFVNLGEMQNKGIDIGLTYRTRSSAKFGWTSNLTISSYRNTVKALASENSAIYSTIDFGRTTTGKTVPGQPIGMFFGYQVLGLFQTPEQLYNAPPQNGKAIDAKLGMYLGDMQFANINKDGVIDVNDRTFIGNPNPDFTYGFTNNFNYKNVDLSIFVQGSYGNDIFNFVRVWGERMTETSGNQMAAVKDRWTPVNTNTTVPRYANGDPNDNQRPSTRFIEDGSYLRIQNISLGYTLPEPILKKLRYVNRFRAYITIQNLYTFTDYTGLDPEIGSYNGNPLLTGVDLGRYPVPRSFTAGFNVEF